MLLIPGAELYNEGFLLCHILLSKVVCCGALEYYLVWLTSYLSYHISSKCVYKEYLLRAWGEIHVGMPQGSMLGPVK